MNHKQFMLLARDLRGLSTCHRRKIGAVYRLGQSHWSGFNAPAIEPCHQCHRENGECGAIHAEVNALLNAGKENMILGSHLYVWCEIPCTACLSFIKQYSNGYCKNIHCLSASTYGDEYPRLLKNLNNIEQRFWYATELGLNVKTYDMHELLALVEE